MRRKNIFLSAIVVIFFTIIATSCWGPDKGTRNDNIRNVPPGYIGKILTPTGWDSKILEAGQVDIGDLNREGQGNNLTILEATSITLKEQFGDGNSSGDKQDHRVMVGGTVPLSVDVYIQAMIPTKQDLRDAIFAQVTPATVEKDERVRVIWLGAIYNKFAQQFVRGKLRGIFTRYKDYKDVMDNYEKINAEIAQSIMDVFKTNRVPLELISCQLSNIKQDDRILDATNNLVSADSKVKEIEMIGEAIRKNPSYLEVKRLETYERISQKGGNTFIISDGKTGMNYTLPTPK